MAIILGVNMLYINLKEIPMAPKGFNDVSCLTTLLLLLCSEAKEVSNRDLCTWFGVGGGVSGREDGRISD